MSPRPPAGPGAGSPADRDAEARELEDYFRRQDPVDVAAADWHTRREQGLSDAEDAEFRRWLSADRAHAEAFRRLDRSTALLRSLPVGTRDRLRAASASTAEAPASGRPPVDRPGASRRRAGPFPRPAAMGLCAAVLLAVGMGWHSWRQQPTFVGSYATERGQRLSATLPDSTGLTLDAESKAEVTLYRDRREVRLTEGQALFAVAPDSGKPFHVLAGPARVTVVGTRFAVRYRHSGADAGAVNVAVEEGRVRVAGSPADADAAPVLAADLAAGQRITVSSSGVVGQAAAVSPGNVAPWRQGMVRFESIPLADALLELERYGPTRLVVRDPAVAAMRIGGSYRIGHPGDLARVLPQILPVRLVAGAGGDTEVVRAR